MVDPALVEQFSTTAAGPLRIMWLGRRPRLDFFAEARRDVPRPSAYAVLFGVLYVEIRLPRRRPRN